MEVFSFSYFGRREVAPFFLAMGRCRVACAAVEAETFSFSRAVTFVKLIFVRRARRREGGTDAHDCGDRAPLF
jgi:hypothetical protein